MGLNQPLPAPHQKEERMEIADIVIIILLIAVGYFYCQVIDRRVNFSISKNIDEAADSIVNKVRALLLDLQDSLSKDKSFSCTNPTCKKRTTCNEYLDNRLIKIGLNAYERKYVSKINLSETASISDINTIGDLTEAAKEAGAETTQCWVDAVTKANKDTTEDVEAHIGDGCESVFPIKSVADGLKDEYIKKLKNMGFSNEQLSEMTFTSMLDNSGLIGAHPEHKPVVITEDGVEWLEASTKNININHADLTDDPSSDPSLKETIKHIGENT
jgi:hypothetical protein